MAINYTAVIICALICVSVVFIACWGGSKK